MYSKVIQLLFIYICVGGGGGFPGDSVVKNPPVNAGDIGDSSSVPGWGRCPGGGHDNPLQYSCLANPMDKGAWQATVHGVAKRWTWLATEHTHTHVYVYTRVYIYICIYTHIYITEHIHSVYVLFFFRFFSIISYYKILSIVVPCNISRSL